MKEDGACGDEDVDFHFGWFEFEVLTGHPDTNDQLSKKKSLKSGMEIISFHHSDLGVISSHGSLEGTMEMYVTTQDTLFRLYLTVKEPFSLDFQVSLTWKTSLLFVMS